MFIFHDRAARTDAVISCAHRWFLLRSGENARTYAACTRPHSCSTAGTIATKSDACTSATSSARPIKSVRRTNFLMIFVKPTRFSRL